MQPALDRTLGVRQFTTPLLLAGAFLVRLIRWPQDLLRAEFTWEEGTALYLPAFFGAPILEPWAGYLNVIPRVAYQALALLPPLWGPLVENLAAHLLVLAVAVFIVRRFDSPIALPLALLLLVGPTQFAMAASLLNAQWYLGIWLIVLALAREASGPMRWVERILTALTALSGPVFIFLAPLFVLRRTRHYLSLAIVLAVFGAIQLGVVLAEGRDPVAGSDDPVRTLFGIAYRSGVFLLGERIGWAFRGETALAGLALILAYVALWWRLPHRFAWGYGAAVTAAAGVWTQGPLLLTVGGGQRYFLAASFVVVVAILYGVTQRGRLAYVLALLLIAGTLGDMRQWDRPDLHWERTHSCIGSPDSCVIPVTPPRWSMYWPGADATYDIPRMP